MIDVPKFEQPYASSRPAAMDDSTSTLELPVSKLDQLVSLSNRGAIHSFPLSLGQFIRHYDPELLMKHQIEILHFDSRHREPVRGIWDLSEVERWELLYLRVIQGYSPSLRHRIPPIEKLYDHIKRTTHAALDLKIMMEQRIYILEKAVIEGRLQLKA